MKPHLSLAPIAIAILRILIAILGVGASVHVAIANSRDDAAIRAAKQAVTDALKDPESARFKEVRVVRGKAVNAAVCGQVNAKNSFSGYVGFKRFVVLVGEVPGVDPLAWAN